MINSYKIYFLIFKLLNLSNKFYLLLFLTLIATAFEVMSIGSLLPLLQVMVNENALDQYGNIKSILLTLSPLKLFGQMQNYEHLNFVASISTVILILFILKFLYLVFFEWYKAKFLHELEFKLSNRIFKGYILSPYSYHTQKNTSEFHRDIQSDVNYFIGSSASVATLVTEIFVVIGLAGLILSVEFQSSILGLFTVLIFGMLFIKVTSSFNSRLGSKVHSSMQLRIKNFIHGLEGIKEVILFNKQKNFIDWFKDSNKALVSAKKKHAIIVSLPRLFVEILLVLGFFIIMFVLLSKTNSIRDAIPFLGFFAGASFRLTPSVYRIVNCIQRIKFTVKPVNNLFEKIQLTTTSNQSEKTESQIIFKNKLIVENLSFSYPEKKNVLRNINLEIKEGEAIGIFGESGSGKSTLVNLITGLFTPSGGKIYSDGKEIAKNIFSWRENIGYVPQSIFLLDDSIKNNIAFGVNEEKIDLNNINYAIENSELDSFVDKLENKIDTNVGEKGVKISGGQLQRVGIARALYHNPKILIFDESTSSLDKKTEQEILANLYSFKKRKTVIFITHKVDLLNNCDHVYELKKNNIHKVR